MRANRQNLKVGDFLVVEDSPHNRKSITVKSIAKHYAIVEISYFSGETMQLEYNFHHDILCYDAYPGREGIIYFMLVP